MWKDTTSRSRGEGDAEPRAWTLSTPDLRVIVHRHRDHAPTTWLVSVHGAVDLGPFTLESNGIDDAKREALYQVRRRLRALVGQLPVE